jgi:hypothetical protein
VRAARSSGSKANEPTRSPKAPDWDRERDQLARNVEAFGGHRAARGSGLLCDRSATKRTYDGTRRDSSEGYRQGTLVGGMAHLDAAERARFRDRIGTVIWSAVVDEWRPLRDLPELADLASA